MSEEWMWQVVSVAIPYPAPEPMTGSPYQPRVVVDVGIAPNHNHPDLQAIDRKGLAEMVMGAGLMSEENFRLRKALTGLLEGYGYTSFLSDEEREADPDVIAARAALAEARGEA